MYGPLNASSFAWNAGCEGPDVIFGGGAEQFIAGSGSPGGTDFYKAFQARGYNVVYDKDGLQKTDEGVKTLGIFTQGNMAKWHFKIFRDRGLVTDFEIGSTAKCILTI